MLDRYALKISKPLVDRVAVSIRECGFTADHVTFFGFGLGLASALCVGFGLHTTAIFPMLVSRFCDGLDGAVARQATATDRGAFLDISLDFIFYASIPLAFAVSNPMHNALAAATLLAAFVGTGSGFLAYAIIAEKRGLKSTAYPTKTFYYLGGLTEGSETIACFLAMCIWPQHFAVLAYFYACLCALTTATRLLAGWQAFVVTKH